jgi:predicted transcriptional regulator
MMPKKRTKDLIISEILKVCINGVSITSLSHKANLNSKVARPHLNNLIKKGFVDAVNDGTRINYKTTPKGLKIKERFERFQSELDALYACV